MATITAEGSASEAVERDLRRGSWLMGIAAVGFIGYAASSSSATSRTRS